MVYQKTMKLSSALRKSAALLLCGLLLPACSDPKLVGEWKVSSLEIVKPGQETVQVQHIGTFTFNSDGTGRRNIKYSVLGQPYADTLGFRWSIKDKYLTLEGDSTQIAKVWIMEEDGRFEQRWKSTNGRGQVQTLQLEK